MFEFSEEPEEDFDDLEANKRYRLGAAILQSYTDLVVEFTRKQTDFYTPVGILAEITTCLEAAQDHILSLMCQEDMDDIRGRRLSNDHEKSG